VILTTRYKIRVKTVTNEPLNYTVSEYSVEDGYLIFIDEYTNKKKQYAVANTEIEVLEPQEEGVD